MSQIVGREESYAAYLDELGKPRLVESSLLFFDLLGTRAMSTGPDASGNLARLRPALTEAIQQSQVDHEWSRLVSTWFTDNAVVAEPIVTPHGSEGAIGGLESVAADLLVGCWRRGFLGRGAITFGDHYMDERFVFGPALIEAVELEKATKWPRVELGKSAVQAETKHSSYYSHPLQSAQSHFLTRDETGAVFVDHLGTCLSMASSDQTDALLKDLKQTTTSELAALAENSAAWLKWRWLAEYQNHAIATHLSEPEAYLVQVPDVRHTFSDFLDPAPDTAPGSPWYRMDRQDRYSPGELAFESMVPANPGVYALYQNGTRMYVGETGNLHTRIVRTHLAGSQTMRDSALRRNVSELLGFATAAAIKDGTYVPSDGQVAQVRAWICDCEIAWIECATKAEAKVLERALKAQTLPPLTKR